MQSKVDKKSLKRLVCDVILILALLVVGLFALLIARLTAEDGGKLIVKHDREQICEIPLDVDAEYPLLDGKNILVVSEGEAYMRHAECPAKRCVRQGKISKSGEWIYCSPHKLSIVVE